MVRGGDIDFCSTPIDGAAHGRRAPSRGKPLSGVASSLAALDKVTSASQHHKTQQPHLERAPSSQIGSSQRSLTATLDRGTRSRSSSRGTERRHSCRADAAEELGGLGAGPAPSSQCGERRSKLAEAAEELGALDVGLGLSISAMGIKAPPLATPARKIYQAPTNAAQRSNATITASGSDAPVSMERAKTWDPAVENAYRFQEAGYRDEREFIAITGGMQVERWPDTGFVKKLPTKTSLGAALSNLYFPKARQCKDSELPRVKLFKYAD